MIANTSPTAKIGHQPLDHVLDGQDLSSPTASRDQEVREAFAHPHAADPVLAALIDKRPDYDPDAWLRELPVMDLFRSSVGSTSPSAGDIVAGLANPAFVVEITAVAVVAT